MKSTRFSSSAGTPRTCARNKGKKNRTWLTPTWLRHQAKKKSAPGPRQPGSDTKQKKSEHLAHSLAQLPNKKNCPRYQAKKREQLAHPNLAQIPSKIKRSGSDTKQQKREHLTQKVTKQPNLRCASWRWKTLELFKTTYTSHWRQDIVQHLPRVTQH